MLYRSLLLTVLLLAAPVAAKAGRIETVMEQVEKQRHLAMIEADINSNNARNISLLGLMSYEHDTCGDDIVTDHDIAAVWNFLKQGTVLDEQIRTSQTAVYAAALAEALGTVSAEEKTQICTNAQNGLRSLKQGWGLQ